MTAKTIEELKARIAELEAENEILKKDVASESRWAEHYHKRADEFEALNAASREEIDRLCALLGQADAGPKCPQCKQPLAQNEFPSGGTFWSCLSGCDDATPKGGDA